jgi:hypothetical protein
MNGEQKFWLSLWAIIGTVIVSVTAASLLYHREKYQKMIEAGYEQGVLPGKSDVYWVKGDPK